MTRPKRPLSQITIGTSNHATWEVYSSKAVETLMYRKCYGLLFSLLCIKYFSFGLIKALGSKGILNTLKKGITSAMECTVVAAFTFATNK